MNLLLGVLLHVYAITPNLIVYLSGIVEPPKNYVNVFHHLNCARVLDLYLTSLKNDLANLGLRKFDSSVR